MIPEPRQAWLRNGMTLAQILAKDFRFDGFEEPINLRTYFVRLLFKVWDEGEQFDGKRPFGNSDWQDRVRQLFIDDGILDEDSSDRDFLLTIKSLISAL